MNQGKQDSQNSQNHQEPEGPIIPQDPERPGPGWARLMERQENQYHAWNTLVGTTAIGELTITPLTDERQLFEEARIMMHAVFAYGPRCASGISRIFSLNRGGPTRFHHGARPPGRPVGPGPDPGAPERTAPKGLPRRRPTDCRPVHPGVAEHPRPQLVAGAGHRVGPRPTQPPTEGETVCSTHRTPPEKTR